MKKRLLISGLLISGLMVGSIAMANPHSFANGNYHGGNHEGQQQQNVLTRFAQMDALLNLDAGQQQQFRALLNKYWQAEQVVSQRGNAKHEARHDTMHSNAVDEATIRNNLATRAGFEADQLIKQMKLKSDLYAILTAEQQESAEKLWNAGGHHSNGNHSTGSGF